MLSGEPEPSSVNIFSTPSAFVPTEVTPTQQFEEPQADYPEPVEAIAEPAPFASDLLGDFGGKPVEISGSPIAAAEFPSSEIMRPDDMDTFARTTKAIESTGDAFDAFASKFDKAAEVSELPTGADPFFDPFASGGQTAMDTSNDGNFVVLFGFLLSKVL